MLKIFIPRFPPKITIEIHNIKNFLTASIGYMRKNKICCLLLKMQTGMNFALRIGPKFVASVCVLG